MFYIVDDLERTVVVHPQYSTKTLEELHKLVRRKGYLEIEGTFDPHYGYIIVFVKYNFISKEVQINKNSGMLEFKIKATVVCQKPMKGEIAHAVVKAVFKEYIIAEFCGCISFIVRASEFAEEDYVFMKEEGTEGRSSQGYFHFQPDPSKDIRVETVILVKFVDRMLGSGGFFLTATMNDGNLGVVAKKPTAEVNQVPTLPTVPTA